MWVVSSAIGLGSLLGIWFEERPKPSKQFLKQQNIFLLVVFFQSRKFILTPTEFLKHNLHNYHLHHFQYKIKLILNCKSSMLRKFHLKFEKFQNQGLQKSSSKSKMYRLNNFLSIFDVFWRRTICFIAWMTCHSNIL